MPSSQRPRPVRQNNGASIKEPEGTQKTSVNPPAEPMLVLERIGDMLKREREKRGEDVRSVADYLRIRRGFLEALENNRYDQLPADAYVIGFLRSYANYLGLDGQDAIDRYRKEMAGRRKKPALIVPVPISEGRTPSVAILIGAAVAALFLYGLWYGLSSSDRAVVSEPPPLPSAPSAAAAPSAPVPNSQLPATIASLPNLEALPAGSQAAAPSDATSPSQAPSANASPQSPPAPAGPVPAAGMPSANTAAAAPSQSSQAAAPAAAPSAGAAGAESVQTNFNQPTHLIIRAEKTTWVLIADSKGHTIYDHVLKPGEVYRVPDMPGLLLTTGNASGIILSYDGVDLPRLSSKSRVMHDISLDADKLKAPGGPAGD